MSSLSPKIPRISRIFLFGYHPIFGQSISAEVVNNRLLVLGGNGLGKTTILQSIIYCVAGESDIDIETIKSKRWGRSYFEGRLSNLKDAYVQVEFYLGNDKVTLKRGLRTHLLLEFLLNDESVAGNSSVELNFENYLKENAGYQSIVDFRFILHKLCYLPEDRTNLVWDSENQTRLMMLLFADLINEREFDQKRRQLKQIDSKKRHINVDLNDSKQEYQQLNDRLNDQTVLPTDPKNNDVEIMAIPPKLSKVSDFELTAEVKYLQELSNLSREKMPIQISIKQLRKDLNGITGVIEELQNRLMENEENFILEQLNRYETDEVKLAIHKLIHRQICPACVNSRVMFTTHSRVMFTSHRRTYVYHSASYGGWVKLGQTVRVGLASFWRFRWRKLSPRMVRVWV